MLFGREEKLVFIKRKLITASFSMEDSFFMDCVTMIFLPGDQMESDKAENY